MAAVVRILPGKKAAPFAAAFWNGLDLPAKKAMLWDVPFEQRGKILGECWKNAHIVILASQGKRRALACWGSFIGPASKCLLLHFCFARAARKEAQPMGRLVLSRIFTQTGAQSIIGLVPARYGHALRFLKRLGFLAGHGLSGACPVNGRLYDGVFVSLNRKDFDG